MMSDCSSMRMQSTSCCLSSVNDAASSRCFTAACDMMYASAVFVRVHSPFYLAADLTAPEIPGARRGGQVDCVRKPPFLVVQRSNRRTSSKRHRPMLDARIDLGVHGAKDRRLQRRPAGHSSVRAHE